MTNELLILLQNLAGDLHDAFLVPGSIVLSGLATLAPALAAFLGIGGDETPLLIRAVLSLLIWLMFAFVVWELVRLYRNTARIVGASLRTSHFRTTQYLAGVRTMLVCKFREILPQSRSKNPDTLLEVEFDDLDLAVLDTTAALEPEMGMTVPDLAKHFAMRPGKVQRSVVKLHDNKMLDIVADPKGGKAVYRMTPSGAAFVTMWQRQAKR